MWKKTHALTDYSQIWPTFLWKHDASKVPKVDGNMQMKNWRKMSFKNIKQKFKAPSNVSNLQIILVKKI
jgi:hypothetical protein